MSEAKIHLELTLSEDLYKLLEPSRDVVSVGELIKLAFNLLSGVEAQLSVGAHSCIVGVAILMCANEQINIMSQRPPN